MSTDTELKDRIQEKYGAAARSAAAGAKDVSCCSGSGCCGTDEITSNLYSDGERGNLPEAAVAASLGCGNPTALIELKAGETVLDLGSGGGVDVLLSARRVGPAGKVYGLDMTDDMLALARDNQRKAGVANVEFLKGDIEQIPLPDAAVDVLISNCDINLTVDKSRVLAEAFRVLKPGGRFAVSDIVIHGEVPPAVRHNLELWVGCVGGALQDTEYVSKLSTAGFIDVKIEPWRVYDMQAAPEQGTGCCDDQSVGAHGTFASAFMRATKPAA